MHNPIRLLPMRGTTFVENQCLPHANAPRITVDDLVTAGGFPKPGSCCAIGARAGRVFLVLVTKEVPIVLWGGSNFAFLCKENQVLNLINRIGRNRKQLRAESRR